MSEGKKKSEGRSQERENKSEIENISEGVLIGTGNPKFKNKSEIVPNLLESEKSLWKYTTTPN